MTEIKVNFIPLQVKQMLRWTMKPIIKTNLLIDGIWYDKCIDWERNRLPGKHFLAIFSNYPDCGFDRLSLVYKDLPFLNLDEDVIFRGNNVASLEMEEEMELSTMSATNKSVSRLQSSPKQDSISINWSAKCKEGVKQITSLLHVVDDNDILKEAHSLVTSCIELLNRHLCSS